MNYRDRKLLDLAHRLNECCFQLPGCKGYQEHGCEPAHADEQAEGKGYGIKAHDDAHVAACHHCHEAYTRLPREDKHLAFLEGNRRTMHRYFENGWLKVVK